LSINNLLIQALGAEPEEKLLQHKVFILAEMDTKAGKFRKYGVVFNSVFG
jgi:hypothetical protein